MTESDTESSVDGHGVDDADAQEDSESDVESMETDVDDTVSHTAVALRVVRNAAQRACSEAAYAAMQRAIARHSESPESMLLPRPRCESVGPT